jgi:hypothetical protein
MSEKYPISKSQLRSLLDHLDRPDSPACTQDLTETQAWLKNHSIPIEPALEWLRDCGEFCDCEAILNIAHEWGEWAGWMPEDGPLLERRIVEAQHEKATRTS